MSDMMSKGELFNKLATVQTLGEAYGVIQEMPTVDAVPVRHGRWVMKEGELAFWDECSECARKILHRIPHYDFCPNCGADMRKDGDNHDNN